MSSIIAENCDGNFKQLSVITVNFTAVKVLCTPGETWTFSHYTSNTVILITRVFEYRQFKEIIKNNAQFYLSN